MRNILYRNYIRISNFEFAISKSTGNLIIRNDFSQMVYELSAGAHVCEMLDNGLFHDENVNEEYVDASNDRRVELVKQGNYWFINDFRLNAADALKLHEFLEGEFFCKAA